MLKSKIIKVPSNIKIKLNISTIDFKGPLGCVNLKINNKVIFNFEKDLLKLSLKNLKEKKYLNLFNSLIKKKIEDIIFGCKCTLILKGIGYKAEILNNFLILKLGFSHKIKILIPSNIKVVINNNTILNFYGINWSELTQFIHSIRRYRIPEPYKGKGILLQNEIICKKIGKKK